MKPSSASVSLRSYLLGMQFEINCLSSVAIEYPALQAHPLLRLDVGAALASVRATRGEGR